MRNKNLSNFKNKAKKINKNGKRLFFILSGLLAFSLVGSYLKQPITAYTINGQNMNPNVAHFEILKLQNDIPEYQKDYLYLYQQKNKIIKDIELESDIIIPKDIFNQASNEQFENIFQKKAKSVDLFILNLKERFNITPAQFEQSLKREFLFSLFANFMEFSNRTTSNNFSQIEDIISKEITIEYKNKNDDTINKKIRYKEDPDLYLEVLLLSYNNIEENEVGEKIIEISIENKKTNFVIKKIAKINDFKVEEKNIHDITSKSIISYYF